MQRLRSSQHCGQSLPGDPDDVVVRLLGGQGAPGRLGVEAKHPGARVFGLEAVLHDLGPEPAGSPVLGHLFQEIQVGVEEEREPRAEFIHIQTRP